MLIYKVNKIKNKFLTTLIELESVQVTVMLDRDRSTIGIEHVPKFRIMPLERSLEMLDTFYYYNVNGLLKVPYGFQVEVLSKCLLIVFGVEKRLGFGYQVAHLIPALILHCM
ncbi:unnamed protein product [Meloidogyne enterolobii]|uniref:Uncharacterized protein n=1 Tax=Meloidogyne enterolobii TaxID=390850 RepID=A0ACB1ACQ1_MELEN